MNRVTSHFLPFTMNRHQSREPTFRLRFYVLWTLAFIAIYRGWRGHWLFRLMIRLRRDNYVNLRAFFSGLSLEPEQAAKAAD